jgi:hypothetical protein
MAKCPLCHTRLIKNTTLVLPFELCRFCALLEEDPDSSLQEEIDTLVNPSGVTRVVKYEENEE